MKNDYDAPDDDLTGDYYESDGLRWISIVVVILVIFGFFSLAWYAYKTNKDNSDSMGADTVIAADEGAVREKPENPGGVEIEHQDKEVYNRIIAKGGAKKSGENVETLLPEPEEPVVEKTVKSDAPGVESWINSKLHNGAETPQPGKPDEGGNVSTEPSPASEEAKSESAEEKNKPGDEEKPIEVKEAPVATKATPVETKAPVTEVTKKEAKEEEVKKEEVKQAETPKPAPTPAPAPKAAKADEDPIVSAAESYSKPASTPPATSSKGSLQVQLASLPTRGAAEETLSRLRAKHADILGGKQFSIVSAEIPGKGTYYRVRVGGIADKSSVNQICSTLKSRGQDCIPIN